MLIISILLSLFAPQQIVKNKVTVDFKFQSMQLGKPTLAFYYYDVTLKNNTNENVYIAIPRWFKEELTPTDTIWGAQYDSFGDVKGATLFCLSNNNQITIFKLKPQEKIFLKDFEIETFDEDIQKKLSTGINIMTFSQITVGSLSFEDFMDKGDLHNDNLPFQTKNAEIKSITIKTSK